MGTKLKKERKWAKEANETRVSTGRREGEGKEGEEITHFYTVGKLEDLLSCRGKCSFQRFFFGTTGCRYCLQAINDFLIHTRYK